MSDRVQCKWNTSCSEELSEKVRPGCWTHHSLGRRLMLWSTLENTTPFEQHQESHSKCLTASNIVKVCIVCTQWLSLHPAVDHLLQTWHTLTPYFMSFWETFPVALKRIFEDEVINWSCWDLHILSPKCRLCFGPGCKIKAGEIKTLHHRCSWENLTIQNVDVSAKTQHFLWMQDQAQLMEKLVSTRRSKQPEDLMKVYDSINADTDTRFGFSPVHSETETDQPLGPTSPSLTWSEWCLTSKGQGSSVWINAMKSSTIARRK